MPEDTTAGSVIFQSVPINPLRAKEDEDFEMVEYVVSPAGTGRQEAGKQLSEGEAVKRQ